MGFICPSIKWVLNEWFIMKKMEQFIPIWWMGKSLEPTMFSLIKHLRRCRWSWMSKSISYKKWEVSNNNTRNLCWACQCISHVCAGSIRIFHALPEKNISFLEKLFLQPFYLHPTALTSLGPKITGLLFYPSFHQV